MLGYKAKKVVCFTRAPDTLQLKTLCMLGPVRQAKQGGDLKQDRSWIQTQSFPAEGRHFSYSNQSI